MWGWPVHMRLPQTLTEREAEDISYVLVRSAYGRPHLDAVRVLVALVRCTARLMHN